MRLIEEDLKITKPLSIVLVFCNRLTERFTAKSYKMGGCRIFGKSTTVPENIEEQFSENSCMYRRMFKDHCLHQSNKKSNLKSNNLIT